jgi:hypothetical protein
VTAAVRGMGLVDGRGRASYLGTRKAFDVSTIIRPEVYEKTSYGQRESVRRYTRFHPFEKIVWIRSGEGRLWWTTVERARIEADLLAMARKRQRGLRKSFAELARWVGSTPMTVSRVLRSLADRGIGVLTTGRGRYASTSFVLVGNSMQQSIGSKGDALTSKHELQRRDRDVIDEAGLALVRIRESQREWMTLERAEELEALAEHWRYRLALSLSYIGFHGEGAQERYLAFMDEIVEGGR